MSTHHARRALAAMPTVLRQVLFDDATFTTTGKFSQLSQLANWPGGLYRQTATVAGNVQAGDPLTQVTMPVFRVTGREQEGFELGGAQEDEGPVDFWLRALQGPNQTWQKVRAGIGSTIPYLLYAGGPAGDFSESAFANRRPDGYPTQSYFDRMQQPMLYVRGLPAGSYQPRLVKTPNAAAGDSSTSNRATYLDLLRVYTYYPF